MPLQYVAYAFMQPGGTRPECKLHTVSSEVAAYLRDHVDDLLKRVERGSSAPAYFRRPEARHRFDELRTGTESQFVAAAQGLAADLHTAMDQRSKRGFFVALREIGEGGDLRAAALKLDVNDKRAAVVQLVDSDLELEMIKDLLDLPGELQKGAVTPDPRADSELVVGDKATEETAKYFLRALEVQQISPPSQGPSLLIRALKAVAPDHVQEMAEVISDYKTPVTPNQLFDDHPKVLSTVQRDEVLKLLEDETRPVRIINPIEKPPRAEVRADGISIAGPARIIDRQVAWTRRDGQWVIEIRVAQEPRRTYY